MRGSLFHHKGTTAHTNNMPARRTIPRKRQTIKCNMLAPQYRRVAAPPECWWFLGHAWPRLLIKKKCTAAAFSFVDIYSWRRTLINKVRYWLLFNAFYAQCWSAYLWAACSACTRSRAVATYAHNVIVAQTTLFILSQVAPRSLKTQASACTMRVSVTISIWFYCFRNAICISVIGKVCAAVAHTHSLSEVREKEQRAQWFETVTTKCFVQIKTHKRLTEKKRLSWWSCW